MTIERRAPGGVDSDNDFYDVLESPELQMSTR